MKNSKIDRIIIKHLVKDGYGDDEKLYKAVKSIVVDILEIEEKEDIKKERNKKFLHYIDKIKDNFKSTLNKHTDNYNLGHNSAIKYCLKILDINAEMIKNEINKKY